MNYVNVQLASHAHVTQPTYKGNEPPATYMEVDITLPSDARYSPDEVCVEILSL